MERGVEVAHGHDKRVDGTTVFQVAHEIDVEVLESALCLVDAVKVEKALRGVHVRAVAGVDDRHGRDFRGILRGAFNEVAHHDDVGIVAHHEDGVLESLAFGRA